MPNVFCVRADSGQYTEHFIRGGYAGIGWFHEVDLSQFRSRDELLALYPEKHPWDTSRIAIGVNVGQIARFRFEIQTGDIVLTPFVDSRQLAWGVVRGDYRFVGPKPKDGCRFGHRRAVDWQKEALRRHTLSIPLQASLKATLTVFRVHPDPVLAHFVGLKDFAKPEPSNDPQEAVLARVLELHPTEFELLVKELLASLGFDAEHVGKVGDDGVDATGLLDVYNLAKIQLFVQAKRYKRGSRIPGKTVQSLRQKIPHHAQGAFITTADFQKDAFDVAEEPGFPRIGLMNGTQLVELLTEQWDKLPEEIREKLGLRKGLLIE